MDKAKNKSKNPQANHGNIHENRRLSMIPEPEFDGASFWFKNLELRIKVRKQEKKENRFFLKNT